MDIIVELEKYVENSMKSAELAKDLMEKAASEENYMKAAEMKVEHGLYTMFAMRIQRLIEGKPAFVETKAQLTGA